MMTLSFGTAGLAVCQTSVAADLGMDLGQGGVFLSGPFWGVIVAIFVAGPLADRWGFRPLMVAGAVLSCSGMLILSRAGAPWQAVAGGAVMGVGGGFVDALTTPIVCAVYPERRTPASNLLHAFYAVGVIVTVSLILLLMRAQVSWRGIYVVLSLLVLPVGLAFCLLPLPRQSHEAGSVREPTRRLLRRGPLLLLVLAIFLGGATELGPASWTPTLLERSIGGSRLLGGLVLILFGVTMAAGRLSCSFLVDRLGPRRMFLGGGAICAVSLLLASLPVGTGFTVFWLAVLGFGVAGFWPTILGCAGDRFPRAGASLYSVLSAAGNLSGVAAPVAMGFAGEAWGLPAAMRLLILAPLCVPLIMNLGVLGPRPERSACIDTPASGG
ncbi:MAG: hypothetical protein BIFFINMI_01047 [Phycisphaerae bacterium]|nr:hypothetical protein [Phycisphaerae bacterium]